MPSKSVWCQIILSCLCPPRAIHATTLAFIKFRIILSFSVKDETRKTLLQLLLSCLLHIRQTYPSLSVQGITFLHPPEEEGRKERREGGSFPPHQKFLWLLLSWKHFKCQMCIRNSRLLSSFCASWFYQVDLPGSVGLPCPPGARIPYNRANHPCLPTGTLDLIKTAWYTPTQHMCTCTNSTSPCTDRAMTPSDLPTCQHSMGLIKHPCELPPDPRAYYKIRAIV